MTSPLLQADPPLQWRVGDRATHPNRGTGIIERIEALNSRNDHKYGIQVDAIARNGRGVVDMILDDGTRIWCPVSTIVEPKTQAKNADGN